jgi:hypothetical protein
MVLRSPLPGSFKTMGDSSPKNKDKKDKQKKAEAGKKKDAKKATK